MLAMKRRTFLKAAAATAAFASVLPRFASAKIELPDYVLGHSGNIPDNWVKDRKIVRTVCYMCHGGCGAEATVQDGEVVKIDGNPYHPNSYDYALTGKELKPGDLDDLEPEGSEVGSLCPKGQAGIYRLYNPRRLVHPIKRVGERGSRKYKRITWEEAYNEIVNGGDLFGEGHVDGLKAVLSDEPIPAEDSDYNDEAPPEGWGPRRNQYLWMRGRDENTAITKRFAKATGSINGYSTHYTICETSRHETLKKMGMNGARDYWNATYLLLLGSNVYDSDFPAQTQARYLSKWFHRRPGTKLTYVGPRLIKGAGVHGEWVPVKPGTDNAFLLGMIKYIIENNLYNADLMSRPNEASAIKGGYPVYTDFTYLVSNSEPRTYLKEGDKPLVVSGGKVVTADSVDKADLEASTPQGKTVFSLLKERASQYSYDELNDFCGIPRGTIERIAREFATADKPVADAYKGNCQHSNGWEQMLYMGILNLMLDRYLRPGGFTGGGGAFHGHVGEATKVELKGVRVDCAGSGEYKGAKPSATRQWYPYAPGFGDGVQQVYYANVAKGYPYRVKILMHYKSDPCYTLPRNQVAIAALTKKDANGRYWIPLTASIDPFCNETSMLCDYIIPDTVYLELHRSMHTHGIVKIGPADGVAIPAIGNAFDVGKEYRGLYPDVKTVNQIHIDLAVKAGLPNFGTNADGHGHNVFTDTEFWNLFWEEGDYAGSGGGLNPDADHIKLGGKFVAKWNDGSVPKGETPSSAKFIAAYPEKIATFKNALTGDYWEIYPPLRWNINAKWEEISYNKDEYPYIVGTHKDMHHTHSRTAANLWLMSLEPENGLEINSNTAAKLGVKTGDWVEIEGLLGDKVRAKVIVTETIRDDYGEIKHSYGRWELGSRDIPIEGYPNGGIKGDPRVGAGTYIQPCMLPDTAYLGDDPDTIPNITEQVSGSAGQYAAVSKIRKISI